MLYIYNTLTKQKELFQPRNIGKISIYVCGMTVYDDCHLGHARIFICFDVIVRYLRALGYEVTYIRNITDIDDKIIKRANELHIDFKSLTATVIDSMHADEKALGVYPPTFEPRVTEYIPNIIVMIQTLITKGYAYYTENGDIYFDISKFPTYGKLAHQNLEGLKNNVRIEVNDVKHNALDFALWKSAKLDEPFWASPWSNGRPGWHIECSVMAKHFLGDNFDIHGGGADLQFPHHENELAQSEAANGCQFANYWMHVGFVQINKEKMSKSLGNIFTIKAALQQFHSEVIRYFMLSSHYRSPINYSVENLNNAKNALQKLYLTLRGLKPNNISNLKFCKKHLQQTFGVHAKGPGEQEQKKYKTINCDGYIFAKKFFEAMNDDFNTVQALSILFDLAHEINRLNDNNITKKANALGTILLYLGNLCGILQTDPEIFLKPNINNTKIETLIAARNKARNNRNWALADKIRDELNELGIIIEDTPTGTNWRSNNGKN
jgi:cysteinyl-tRNA synthetase